MSAPHHPVRKRRRPAPAALCPATLPAAATALPPADSSSASALAADPPAGRLRCPAAPDQSAEAAPPESPTPAGDMVQRHFARLSALIDKAERVADALLDALLGKAQRREPVYPGELIHICRGLHVLARCGTELARASRQAAPRGITEAQVVQLEARFRKALGI